MDKAYFENKTEKTRESIQAFLNEKKKLFVGSSFQSHSIPLLHIISTINKDIHVYFIDTGFHFPETIRYKEHIAELLELTVISTRSTVCKRLQCDENGWFIFTADPDYCCYLNKIQPLEPVLIEHDVWINGVRADQSETRRQMGTIAKGPFNTLRYHPMLNWNNKEIYYYRKLYKLPPHPLEEKGYLSIGCEPCTRKVDPLGDQRQGRWFGMKKTECGLHTDLIQK